MWNMTGDRALICSVECLAHTSPHVGASFGLPATLISPPCMSLQPLLPTLLQSSTPRAATPAAPRLSWVLHVLPGLSGVEEAGTKLRYTAALPLKDNSVYCICQASAPNLGKSIAHLLPESKPVLMFILCEVLLILFGELSHGWKLKIVLQEFYRGVISRY